MATVILSAAGAAIGGGLGGSVLGLSMAAVGRFAGAVIGRSIDQRLMGQGSDTVETGRVNRLRLTGTGEGETISQVYGRTRVAGQVIWATEFLETVRETGGGGGKGAPSRPKTRSYSYSVSLAIALCEGEITRVGRIWADGLEVPREDLTLRVYTGSRDQLPDPKIEAVEGVGTVPAYRGTAYVVIEDLDLTPYGGRVPQFSFEVSRPAQEGVDAAEGDLVQAVRGVALLPGSGEYALATTVANVTYGYGARRAVNANSPSGKSDFSTSLDHLTGELPRAKATSLVVSWFGDDLRCGDCTIRPKVEQKTYDAGNMRWRVSGLSRAQAEAVPEDGAGQPIYGGTPTDQSVIEAILALNAAGRDVMYYPFILMDQQGGNARPDPYSDAADQPVLPWRGRITTSKAPNQPGSTDGTAAAEAEVAAFFGTANAADFSIAGGFTAAQSEVFTSATALLQYSGPVTVSPVQYSGPNEWGYRRFILHQAALCVAAGGVESFCIGSEMRGLTQIRGENNSFPAVAALIDLATEVRALLGPDVKIGYAADWSEYFGYQPQDGSGDRFFHLDPLWANANIDFIGIDNYMPLSDWRSGTVHADAEGGWASIYDLEYLKANVEGGEGYDWYYATDAAREAQTRTTITDAEHDEPWIWRYKDIRNWWQNLHHDRVGGVRSQTPTAWVPGSKPVRFTEYGCAAVDKGTNHPNRFIDEKSSESLLPAFSDGKRDELIQFQYLKAVSDYWTAPENNPVSEVYDGPMIDMDHAYVWAWDMRPYPQFPNNQELWSDGANYTRGHWINGRVSARSLASVVGEVCARSGLEDIDVTQLYGLVRGYSVDQVGEARGTLQPLTLRYGFDAVERDGVLQFRMRDGAVDYEIDPDFLVRDSEMHGLIEYTRGSEVELAGRVRLRFVEADGSFDVIAEEAILPDQATHAVSTSEFPLVMTRAEGRQTVERWLAEARTASDTLRLTLPPSQMCIGAGDVISIPEEGGQGHYRVDRTDQLSGAQKVEAVRVEADTYEVGEVPDISASLRTFQPPSLIKPLFLDLPLLTGEETPHSPHVAAFGSPWPGNVAVYASDEDANYGLNTLIEAQSAVGVLETTLETAPSGRIDRDDAVQVRMLNGALQSVSDLAFLGGANLCAVGDGTPDGWELMQFRDAELVDTDTYLLSHRLRGQMGTETGSEWPVGSYIVRLDGRARQIDMAEARRGLARYYRIGPAARPVDDPSYSAALLAFDGLGLRPLSPVHLRLNGTPGADRTLTWVRRTRIDGDRWDTLEVPLGEENESYLVRVVQADAVQREEIVNSPDWTYTAAAQTADGLVGAYQIDVAQISAKFGPGRFATLDVPG